MRSQKGLMYAPLLHIHDILKLCVLMVLPGPPIEENLGSIPFPHLFLSQKKGPAL